MSDQVGNSILDILAQGELTIKGKFVWGSNYTFWVDATLGEDMVPAVYKPARGERPLWDFPTHSLAHREVAAFIVSQALGWQLVPETVYRRQGPVGAGSLQRYVEHDPEYHYFTFSEEHRQRLRPVALFDLLINNADRKGSHLLLDAADHIWLIDHGICFHVEDKLRTVIWDFAGEPIPPDLIPSLVLLNQQLQPDTDLYKELRVHLSKGEISVLRQRASSLADEGCYPNPHPNRRPYPWPPL
jgi:uncharacterized repeat protein (TIGR03843 family)